MRLIDADALKEVIHSKSDGMEDLWDTAGVLNAINCSPTVEETEKPFIVKCRDKAIKENLPLYFVYYEETGVFEVYITATKELFEKRHCSKHLLNYEFEDIAIRYLDDYSDWKGGAE